MCALSAIIRSGFNAVRKLKRRVAALEEKGKEIMATIDDIKNDVAALTALADASHSALAQVAALKDQVATLQTQIGSEAPVTQAQLDEIHAGLTGVIGTLQPVTPATPANPAPAPDGPTA